MKKPLVVLLHLGFWGCYFVMIMVMLAMFFRGEEEVEARIEWAFQIIIYFALLPSAITFYAFYFFLFPRYLQQKKFIQATAYGLLISLVAALIGFALLTITQGEDCIDGEGFSTFVGVTLFMSFVALISGIIALVIKGFIIWVEEIKLKATLKQKNQEMEMALLKSQLDPHFLFNTINNIDVLILKDADKASSYLNQLSDIMRFMLYETQTDEILLSKEIEYIDKYIELQKIRTANSKYVSFNVTGKPKDKTIAPMVFIPFIENAFKHTGNKKLENAIIVNIYIEEEYIKLDCINKFDATRKLKQKSNGLGNGLIQKRLNLIYPQKHELKVSNENDLYSIALTINNG